MKVQRVMSNNSNKSNKVTGGAHVLLMLLSHLRAMTTQKSVIPREQSDRGNLMPQQRRLQRA